MTTALLENAARATAVKISYGSIAVLLPGKTRMGSPADHTHRWTVFVRGAQNQDISYAVAKVVFTLHESFEQPVRGEAQPRAVPLALDRPLSPFRGPPLPAQN
jgi:hypothetical protein